MSILVRSQLTLIVQWKNIVVVTSTDWLCKDSVIVCRKSQMLLGVGVPLLSDFSS